MINHIELDKEYIHIYIIHYGIYVYIILYVWKDGYTNEHCKISFICNYVQWMSEHLCRRAHARMFSVLLWYFNPILYEERVMLPAHPPREPLFLLMHIANTFTQECTRVLRPASGRFVVTCPSLNVKTFTEPTMYSALKASRKHFSAVTRGPEQQFCMHFVSVFFYVFSGLFLVLLH